MISNMYTRIHICVPFLTPVVESLEFQMIDEFDTSGDGDG